MEQNNLTDEQIINKIESLERYGYSRTFCAMVFVHYITAGRVSDILNLTGRNFTAGYVCTLPQSKNSEKIVCYIPAYHDIIDTWRMSPARIGGTYSRQSIYRIYKKVGFNLPRGQGRNSSVTHNFRVRRAHDIYLNSGDATEVSAALGHKSMRTAHYYIRDTYRPQSVQRGALGAPTDTNPVIISNRKGVIRAR